MTASTPYPRSVLKRTIKAHSGLNVSKNVDVLLYLDYVLFMQDLMREASIKARGRGATSISPSDIKKAKDNTLAKYNA